MSNPLLGTVLHAIGGVSASSCYLPFQKVKHWSWNSYWLIQALFAWLIFPLIVGYLTVPNLWEVLTNSQITAMYNAFILGAIYWFGGMAFGYADFRHANFRFTIS